VEVITLYVHWQHGRIERQWGTLVPMAQSMIRQAALPKSFWAVAMAAAVRIRNRVHSSGARDVPYELVTCRRADLGSMRVFGCPANVHVSKSQRHKLDDRACKDVLMGYAPESPACLVYNLTTRRVVSSRNVVFDEAAVLFMGESCRALEVQRNGDEKDNTFDSCSLCGDEPDTSLGASPLRGTHTLHNESVENEREVTSGESAIAPHPRYNLRSTASSKQCVPSPRYIPSRTHPLHLRGRSISPRHARRRSRRNRYPYHNRDSGKQMGHPGGTSRGFEALRTAFNTPT
jgi:hypothetical protein